MGRIEGRGLHVTAANIGETDMSLPSTLRPIHLPDRDIYVVRSCQDAEKFRLLNTGPLKEDRAISHSDIVAEKSFEVYLHGSPEHIAALHKSHSDYSLRKQNLRNQSLITWEHYDEMQKIQAELDLLCLQISRLTPGTQEFQHELRGNFSKFGYSHRLRTHDACRRNRDSNGGEKLPSTTLKIYEPPLLRQYFYKGLLWRSTEEEVVTTYELFVDLLYAGILAVIGDQTAEDPGWESLLRFCVIFIPSWRIWNDITLYISWFETDDILQRCGIVFVLACLIGYTTNMVSAFGTTWNQLIVFYLAARIFTAATYLFFSLVVKRARPVLLATAIVIIVPSTLWIGCIFVEAPEREIMVWIAILFDTFGNDVLLILLDGRLVPRPMRTKILKLFEIFPAINIEHKTDRVGAFVTLVFGYSVIGLLYQNQASFGLNGFYIKAFLELLLAFTANWIYFEVDGLHLKTHAIRRNLTCSILWTFLHLPFIMAFVAGSAAASRIVLIQDCAGCQLKSLTEAYQHKSEAELSYGLTWFYCGGMGISLGCMGLISLTHIHRPVQNQRLSKRVRLLGRLAVVAVLLCLPLAHGLQSLQLVAVTTGLVVFVLIMEVIGVSSSDSSFLNRSNSRRHFVVNEGM